MRKYMLLVAFLSLMGSIFAYQLNVSRDWLLEKYYSKVSDQIPKSARLILGSERINVLIGKSTIGIETKNGELASLEMYAIASPTITITVDDATAEKLERREIGALSAMNSGGIRVKTSNLYSAFKVEVLKKIYSASGADKTLTSTPAQSKSGSSAPLSDIQNAFYMRVKIWN
ncbi:MAG: hypothetical protein NT051_03410 [Candidatus Micrarchaeota archaeon]|nr:hypothetical protein [Candidatus Micrarchaeota archaeon]